MLRINRFKMAETISRCMTKRRIFLMLFGLAFCSFVYFKAHKTFITVDFSMTSNFSDYLNSQFEQGKRMFSQTQVAKDGGIYAIDISKPLPTKSGLSYTEALKIWSDENKDIILTYVDKGFLDMAFNFVEASIKRNNIRNILMAAESNETCAKMEDYSIPCFVVKSRFRNDQPDGSRFGSRLFITKMNIRIDMILDALKAGYNVLHSDGDIYFQTNPFPHLDCGKEFDMCTLWDHSMPNAGFLYVRASENTVWMYEEMKKFAIASPGTNDQINLVRYIGVGGKMNKIKHKVLNKGKFLAGKDYFERGRHFYGQNPCETCVVIHDNWIVGHAAKVYRFKEHHMWLYDGTDCYYTNASRKYIRYSNPTDFGNDGKNYEMEVNALKAAFTLGKILKRTVILPRLHCGKGECSLMSKLKMDALDKEFLNEYRENTFLSHPKVPEVIRKSENTTYIITTDKNVLGNNTNVEIKTPKSNDVTRDEIWTWFGKNESPVLNFHSLYGVTIFLEDTGATVRFREKLNSAFKPGKYLQM